MFRDVFIDWFLGNFLKDIGSLFEMRIRGRNCPNHSGNLLSFLLRCGTRPYEWGIELIHVGLQT